MTNEVVAFEPPRLPYVEVIGERFGDLGVNKTSWKALVEAVWPAAKTMDGVILALSYCKARNLDPYKKPVHIVPVWSSALGREVEGVWPGISELRTTAMRTGNYAGCDETDFGPTVEREYVWTDRRGTHEATVAFPEWARLTVYRLIGSTRVPFVGPKVYWLETYATANRQTPAPNEMWRRRPIGQLEKCAEAAALRKAFPEELGNEYAAEEMAGRAVGVDGVPLTTAETIIPAPKKLHAGFSEPAPEEDAEITPVEATESPLQTIDEVLAGDDLPEALKGSSEPEPPMDWNVWVEGMRAEIMRFKTADAALGAWKANFEKISELKEADSELFGRLETWMEARTKRLRQKEADAVNGR